MDLLCVVANSGAAADERLEAARTIARAQGRTEKGKPIARDGVRAVAFLRENGSGAPIVEDLRSGSWILAAGTWFHRNGFASGEESRLLERFLAVGVDRLAGELEGPFAIVAWHAPTGTLSVVTDLCGISHVFLTTARDAIVISGSSLLLSALADDGLDPVGVQEFLYTGIIYEGRTTHREVRKLPAASIVSWDRSLVCRERRYWTMASVEESALDGAAATAAVSDALVSAALRVGGLFRSPASDLTGGRDSRSIAAALLEAKTPFTAVVCGPGTNRDVLVSKRIARAIELPHRHLLADEPASLADVTSTVDTTDGEYDVVEYSRVRRIHSLLAQEHDASLNGTFGELARGHWLGRISSHAGERLDAQSIGPLRFVTQAFDASIVRPELRLDLRSHCAHAVERTNAGLEGLPATAQMQNLYLMMRLQHWFGRIASSTDRIWPSLAPWSLRSVLAPVLSVAPSARMNGLLVKRILEKLNPALARIPLENGCPALPLTLRNLPWFWFAPIEAGRKVAERTSRRWRRAPRERASQLPARMQLLLGDVATARILDPRTMRSAALFEPAALRRFLAHAVQRDFGFDPQWNRLLSLELMLLRREDLRRASRTPAHAADMSPSS